MISMADTIFFYPSILNNHILPEQESRHCVKVLRLQEGDIVTITDGKGSFYECELVQAHPKGCIVEIRNRWDEPLKRSFNIHLAFAPSKQMERNEWLIEKATEIGIDSFAPLLCVRSERKDIKTERLEKIAVSAIKQSKQAYLPVIEPMVRFSDWIGRPFHGRKLIAHCYDWPKEMLTQSYKKGEDILLLIGPEGDFSEDEVEQAVGNGFEPISLGDMRLRSETASLVAIHTIHVINSLSSQKQE